MTELQMKSTIKAMQRFLKEETSRVNVKIASNEETALNGEGPKIADEDIQKLLQKMNKINKEDFELLIKLLEEDNTLTDSEKKELLLDFSIYLYKQVEKKQAAIKKLEEYKDVYNNEERYN